MSLIYLCLFGWHCKKLWSSAGCNSKHWAYSRRMTYRKIPNNSWGIYLFQSVNTPGGNCPFADNSSPHVYLKLLTSLRPPSTRQPGPVAVPLGQTLKLAKFVTFSSQIFERKELNACPQLPPGLSSDWNKSTPRLLFGILWYVIVRE